MLVYQAEIVCVRACVCVCCACACVSVSFCARILRNMFVYHGVASRYTSTMEIMSTEMIRQKSHFHLIISSTFD